MASTGILGDIWSSIATDSNKKIFNMFTDEIWKTIGKHQVSATLCLLQMTIRLIPFIRSSIGRITTLQESKARESLPTPTKAGEEGMRGKDRTGRTKWQELEEVSLPKQR